MKTAKFTHNGIEYEIDIPEPDRWQHHWVTLPPGNDPVWLGWDPAGRVDFVEVVISALRARRVNPSPAERAEMATAVRGGRFMLLGYEYEIETMTSDTLSARRVDTAHLPPCTCPRIHANGEPPCARHGVWADAPAPSQATKATSREPEKERPKERLDQAIQERDTWYEKYQTESAGRSEDVMRLGAIISDHQTRGLRAGDEISRLKDSLEQVSAERDRLRAEVVTAVVDGNLALKRNKIDAETIDMQIRANNETIRERDEARAALSAQMALRDKANIDLAAEREQVGLLKHALEEAQKELQTLKGGYDSACETKERILSEMEGMRVLLKAQDAEIRQYQRARGWEPDEVTPEILRVSFTMMEEKIRELTDHLKRYGKALVDVTRLTSEGSPAWVTAANAIIPETRRIMRVGARVRITGAKTRWDVLVQLVGKEGVIIQPAEGGWMVLVDGGGDVFWFAIHELELIPEAAQSGS